MGAHEYFQSLRLTPLDERFFDSALEAFRCMPSKYQIPSQMKRDFFLGPFYDKTRITAAGEMSKVAWKMAKQVLFEKTASKTNDYFNDESSYSGDERDDDGRVRTSTGEYRHVDMSCKSTTPTTWNPNTGIP
jgi:hypothetical protein